MAEEDLSIREKTVNLLFSLGLIFLGFGVLLLAMFVLLTIIPATSSFFYDGGINLGLGLLWLKATSLLGFILVAISLILYVK